jgi:hypothetical protein
LGGNEYLIAIFCTHSLISLGQVSRFAIVESIAFNRLLILNYLYLAIKGKDQEPFSYETLIPPLTNPKISLENTYTCEKEELV